MKPQNTVVRSTSTVPVDKIWKLVKQAWNIPVVKKGLSLAGSWLLEKVIKKVLTKKKKEVTSPPINNQLKLTIMDKGIFSDKSQLVIITKIKELLKDQKPFMVLLIVMAVKALFTYVDDGIAESKLPQEFTDKCQQFFDALLVENDIEKTMTLGIELIPLIFALFKKDVAIPEVVK